MHFDGQDVGSFHKQTWIDLHQFRGAPGVQYGLVPIVQNGIPSQYLAGFTCIGSGDFSAIQVGHKSIVVIHGKDSVAEFADIRHLERVAHVNAVRGRNLRGIVSISITKSRDAFFPTCRGKIAEHPIGHGLRIGNQVAPSRSVHCHRFPVINGRLCVRK